jgi:hypothetical protein
MIEVADNRQTYFQATNAVLSDYPRNPTMTTCKTASALRKVEPRTLKTAIAQCADLLRLILTTNDERLYEQAQDRLDRLQAHWSISHADINMNAAQRGLLQS